MTSLLTEIERFEGIIILATNRPYDLDEAMYRRITSVHEFSRPSYIYRRQIGRASRMARALAKWTWTKFLSNTN